MDSVKATLEVYDFWLKEGVTSWRLGSRLYHTRWGDPARLGPALEQLLSEAAAVLKASGLYWWNSQAVAVYLITRGEQENPWQKRPRFSPVLEIARNSDFVWRTFLLPDGRYELTCHQVQFDRHWVLDQLAAVNWQQLTARARR